MNYRACIMMTLRHGILFGFALLFAGAAAAQDVAPDDTAYVLQNIWSSSAACNPDKAIPVKVESLLTDVKAYAGQCVAVRGYAFQRALFADADDTVVAHAPSNRDVAARRIGLYASDAVNKALYKRDEPRYVELIGVVGDYAELSGPNVVMVLGYCHYTGGPILKLNTYKTAREPLRLRED